MNYFIPKKRGFLNWFAGLSMTFQIVLVTCFISILGFILWGYGWSPFPASIEYFALKPENIIAGRDLWTLILHVFVHGSPLHLFVNMFVLVSLGALCERIIGRKRFLWFYLISGFFAGLLSVIMSGLFGYGSLANIFGSPGMYMVGASGAIFAIAGLFVILLPKSRFGIIFIPFFSLPAYVMIPAVLILTWVIAIVANLSIGNVAHLGGFLAGIVYGLYLKKKYKKKVALLQKVFR